jgi:hypothetical protein
MADQEQLKILRKGIEAWNSWCGQNQEIQADLSDANLANADLSHAHLFRADLSSADLSGADLAHATLMFANLSGANLYTATLSGANLRCAKLTDANLWAADLNVTDLSGAHLNHADLTFANLNHADLSDADLGNANLANVRLSNAYLNNTDLRKTKVQDTIFDMVDLHTVKGLAEIVHIGPSPVTLYTVQLPQDGSALLFLRGAGVPNEWIDSYLTHVMHPIQYHSVFISYSSHNEILAKRLHADLQDQGVRCWFAPEDMKIGDKIRTRIDEAIHQQDKLLLLLSEHAIASAWVEDEVEAALEKEQHQQREILFPIRLDKSVMQATQAWVAKLRRTRHIGDFTNGVDPRAYQQAFERLLRDLKAERDKQESTYGKSGTS